MSDSTSMLAPYRVLDLTDSRAELAGFIFAGLGADVIKVEPPQGVDSRASDLRFHAYNRGKRSVIIDLESDAGRTDFLRLVATADFVVENAGPQAMHQMGIGFEVLRAVRPNIVHVAISPFGQTGPYAEHLATDLTLAAMGGSMALNGDSDRRPVRITVPQNWHHAAAESVVGALTAHHLRVVTGDAQFVDVSVQAAVFWTGLQGMIAHSIQGKNIERNGTVLQLTTLVTELVYPCADGEVCLIATGPTLKGLIPWMVESGAVTAAWAAQEDWDTYERRLLSADAILVSYDELRTAITTFLRRFTKAELFTRGIRDGMTIAPVNTAADVLAFEQLQQREYWRDLTIEGPTLQTAGPFVKASMTPIRWDRPAPKLGEHTAEVFASLDTPLDTSTQADGEVADGEVAVVEVAVVEVAADVAVDVAANRVPAEPRRRLPLEGVKVADFSWIGVGPISAKVLADHGATVVHIETESPVDRLRMVGPFKDNIAGINRCQFFGAFNTSKMSINLRLKEAGGLAIARSLLEWCDVALDSFTAGTMNGLGLGYDVARELNPSIIMATTCLLGQTGYAARVSGYGYHAAAVSGFYEITGWDDRSPGGPFNAYTDTVAPRFLASTLMAALDHRRRTGQGQFIDQAQMESALHFIAPELLEVQRSGVSPRRNGNYAPGAFPHDAYACAGDDQWCAIAIEADEQWHALCKVLGNPSWITSTMDTIEGRRAAAELIGQEITKFTRSYEPRALMDLLQESGVPAGMVQRSSDHQLDPQFAHRSFFRHLEHPEMGVVPYEGHQFKISGYDNGPRFPAPCIGEHTYEVLQTILGFTDDQIADAYASGSCG
jgi:crotonobetainyl-CoA:carnitine CoA-transferase CaiB-like acyl-CoA transferase